MTITNRVLLAVGLYALFLLVLNRRVVFLAVAVVALVISSKTKDFIKKLKI